MKKSLLILVGVSTLLSGGAVSARTYSNAIACSGWRHGQCTSWNRITVKQEREVKEGTMFGPDYTYYSNYKTLPQSVVTQYSLSPDYRYVSTDHYIYVVDPHSYAVTKVITTTAP